MYILFKVETTISTSESEPKGDKYSQRIFGYLHPEINGKFYSGYFFFIRTIL